MAGNLRHSWCECVFPWLGKEKDCKGWEHLLITVIPVKGFYVNLSHCVLMEKLHARDSSVNIFILKKFYRTEERKSRCCSLIQVFLPGNIPGFSVKACRKSKGLSAIIPNMSQMAGGLQVTHLPRGNR